MPSERERSRPRGREAEVAQQRLEASKLGARAVQRAFRDVLTRKVFAERVGVHPTTVRRWENHGIVEPRLTPILGIPTLVFAEEDVAVGKALAKLLKDRPGELSLRQAREIVRHRR